MEEENKEMEAKIKRLKTKIDDNVAKIKKYNMSREILPLHKLKKALMTAADENESDKMADEISKKDKERMQEDNDRLEAEVKRLKKDKYKIKKYNEDRAKIKKNNESKIVHFNIPKRSLSACYEEFDKLKRLLPTIEKLPGEYYYVTRGAELIGYIHVEEEQKSCELEGHTFHHKVKEIKTVYGKVRKLIKKLQRTIDDDEDEIIIKEPRNKLGEVLITKLVNDLDFDDDDHNDELIWYGHDRYCQDSRDGGGPIPPIRDLIGDHFSGGAVDHLWDESGYGPGIMTHAISIAKQAPRAIDYLFLKFTHELMGLECTERAPSFFSKISKNIEVPMQQFKARIEKDAKILRIIKASRVDYVFAALKGHRRVMLEAFIEGLAGWVSNVEWDDEEDAELDTYWEGDREGGHIDEKKVLNTLRACVNLSIYHEY